MPTAGNEGVKIQGLDGQVEEARVLHDLGKEAILKWPKRPEPNSWPNPAHVKELFRLGFTRLVQFDTKASALQIPRKGESILHDLFAFSVVAAPRRFYRDLAPLAPLFPPVFHQATSSSSFILPGQKHSLPFL